MRAAAILIAILLYSVQPLIAQQYAGLSIDNDLFFGKDYYYSSGIFLKYGHKKNGKEKTKSIHWTLGQEIYTPIARYDRMTTNMDYPFSGYLYLQREVSNAISEKSHFRWGVQLGLSGPPSLSKPIQNAYHKWILRLPELSWEGEQPSGLHIGVLGQYTKIIKIEAHTSFTNQTELHLATHRIESSLRSGLQIGTIEPMAFYDQVLASNSLGWGVHIGIQLKYNVHDYNLSGSLFENSSPFTLPSIPFRNTLEIGVGGRTKQWQFLAMAKAMSHDTPGQKYKRHQVLYLSILRVFK